MRWILVVALVAGCSKKDEGPSCEKVVDNMLSITKSAMAGHGDMELGNRKQMVDQCVKRELTAEQRTCLVNAKDLNALAACTPKK